MGLASAPPPRPGLARALPAGVVALTRVRRQRSISRKNGRDVAVALVIDAMAAERADHYDLAEALGVNDRVARRVLDAEAPLEVGDLIALARSGRGGARLARAVLRRLSQAVDTVVDADTALRSHG